MNNIFEEDEHSSAWHLIELTKKYWKLQAVCIMELITIIGFVATFVIGCCLKNIKRK